MGSDKLAAPIHGKPVIQYSIELFLRHPAFAGVLVTEPRQNNLSLTHPRFWRCEGGVSRCESVFNGLRFLAQQCTGKSQIWVHDAARPCLTHQALSSIVSACDMAATPAIVARRASDSIKRVAKANNQQPLVAEHCDRELYWHAQTPQIATLEQLLTAYQHCLEQGIEVTDEAGALAAINAQVRLISCPVANPKITFTEDLQYASMLLGQKDEKPVH